MPNACAALPKVELHLHLEGAIPPEDLFPLVEKYGAEAEVGGIAGLVARFAFRDFPHFIATWVWKNGFLREAEDFEHMARAVARSLARQNIVYAECHVSPSDFARHGVKTGDYVAAVRRGLARVPEARVALIVDLVRDNGPDGAMRALEEAAELRSLGVVGIGLGGSEHLHPARLFGAVFERARALGLRTTCHAGEASGAQSVREALDVLRAERIGHATRAIEDPALVDRLARERVPLECCPVSNVRTGVVSEIEKHPVRSFARAGCLVTLNTDDPAMFHTSLAGEFAALRDRLGFAPRDLSAVALAAAEACWLPPEEKAALKAELAAAWGAWEAGVGGGAPAQPSPAFSGRT